MKRSYQIMIFATLCLAAMVSSVAVQAQLEEELGLDEIQSNANPLQVIPGAPPEIQEAAAALLDSRDSIDFEKISADRPRPSFGPSFEATLVGSMKTTKRNSMSTSLPSKKNSILLLSLLSILTVTNRLPKKSSSPTRAGRKSLLWSRTGPRTTPLDVSEQLAPSPPRHAKLCHP